ncbi:ArsR/SmtB family transcription factor [Tichowtungia aerotolerans]|uniref:Metalloregulator ArsR/SmtB family transcription factor n=1 Tax=Tichowtungia aerotolerans TaxID=2697043 RepID=A0A6P1M7B2_9BACT|nr:metalloregulator ArsR/SmtB family transcription factor [Tichowtungia aerotolerans]QHI69741.1 metalloregulator ArsR/SmtB family transcription factor [Tichowtungia aerotolerans]
MERYDVKQKDYQGQATVMKALAHPSRLLIVYALMEHELCVCELRELLDQTLPTVSRHLSVLKNAGLLREEKRGLYVYYHLTCPCIGDFLACVGRITGEAECPH